MLQYLLMMLFVVCLHAPSLVHSFSPPPGNGNGNGNGLNVAIMVPCDIDQPITSVRYNAGEQAAHSSNYCAFDGRYVTKPHWNFDENTQTESGKVLQGQTDYKVGRDILSGKGYRLPTLNELLRLVNFNVNRAAPADQLFSDYEVVNNWFKTSTTDFLDGYIVSSTFDKSSMNVYGIDIASRHIVKLNPSAIYTNPAATPSLITDNTATAPTDRPLLILGVSDYFQMVNLSENKCLGVTPPDPDVYSRVSINLEDCDSGSIYQRWKFNDDRLYAQARDTAEYCVNMSDGTLDTPSADCTFISDSPDFNQEGTIKNNSDQYLKMNLPGPGSSLSDNENEGTQWFLQY